MICLFSGKGDWSNRLTFVTIILRCVAAWRALWIICSQPSADYSTRRLLVSSYLHRQADLLYCVQRQLLPWSNHLIRTRAEYCTIVIFVPGKVVTEIGQRTTALKVAMSYSRTFLINVIITFVCIIKGSHMFWNRSTRVNCGADVATFDMSVSLSISFARRSSHVIPQCLSLLTQSHTRVGEGGNFSNVATSETGGHDGRRVVLDLKERKNTVI